MEIQDLADLLLETAQHHDHFEKVAPAHHWYDWYAAYLLARQEGSAPDLAVEAANRYMAEVKAIAIPERGDPATS